MIRFSISADKPVNMSADDAVIIRGGYYIPSVSSEGDLSWSPSKSDMPSVAPVNIKGPPGVTGAQGPQGEPGKDGGGGGTSVPNAVLYSEQKLTEEQQTQARENIGAVGADEIDITNQKLTAIKSNIDGIENTLQESGVSGAIQYQFTILEESGADVDVELSSDELVELNSTIAALRSLKKSNTAIIAFLTDLHIANAIATKIKKAIAGYNKISASVKTDLLLFGGDYLENNTTTTKEQALTLYSYLRDILSYCNDKAPVAVLKGNHDDNTMHTDYINGLIDFETFWAELGNIDDDRTVRNAGNIEDCYGYYDIPNQKVRVFYVNTVDLPQKLIEATNSVNYKGQWDTGISIEQLQFIADNLKFDTSGWHVMVFSHHPIMRDIAIENGCGVQADRGGSALLELLDKFNTTNTSGSISVTGKDFEGAVNYDFTNNQDCKIVACVNGHTHRDSVELYNNSFFCISTRAVYGHPSYDGHISSSAYFVVDRNNNKLHLVYNGDGEENVFNYGSLTTGEEEIEPVYEEITSPFDWQVGLINGDTGELEGDSQTMRIVSTEIIGFTTPAVIDMSEYSSKYAYYLYDIDGNYIECSSDWTSSDVQFELAADRTVRFKVCHNDYAVWTDESINTFASAIKVYVEEGGESYIVDDTHPDPDEPDVPANVEIASPFEWEIAVINDISGSIESDSQNMRISSTEIIGFTTSATIDMSAYNAMYQPYWYDTDGNYIETGASWISTSTPFTLPVDRTVRLKVRNNNYEVWTAESINTFASAVKVTVAKGGEAYTLGNPEPDFPEIVLGEPIQNVLYAIGGSSSDGTKGFDVYGNGARMTALTTYGVKPLVDANAVCSGDVYFIEIPAEATKVVVTSPGFIFGILLLTYANDAFTRDVDSGWQTLNGGEYSFEAGACSHIAINFKNSSNTTIPADTDTSGFSIMFE